MKTKSLILLLSISLISFCSCGPQKNETQGSDQTEQTDDGIHRMSDYAYTDSLMQGSHKVVYTITRQPDENLKH